MTFDSTTVENDPFLIELRIRVSELEAEKDSARKAFEADQSNARLRLRYDAKTILWARATNDYHSALRAVLLP